MRNAQSILGRLTGAKLLGPEGAVKAIDFLVSPDGKDDDKAQLLSEIKPEACTPEVLAAMRDHLRRMTALLHRSKTMSIVDICGTGGDGGHHPGYGMPNFSTAAALIAAATGKVGVAKHCGGASTSMTGSADILAKVGIEARHDTRRILDCIRTYGLGFLPAPLFHPLLVRVARARKLVGKPTIFNMLCPLVNPLEPKPRAQVIGVWDKHVLHVMAKVLKQDTKRDHTLRYALVHGLDGVDEVSLPGGTFVVHIRDGGFESETLTHRDFGLPKIGWSDVLYRDPARATDFFYKALQEDGHLAATAVANAGLAMKLVQRDLSLKQCVGIARQAVEIGMAKRKLCQVRDFMRSVA